MQAQPGLNRLAELRKARGEERWELSALVERDSTTIWRWETGRSPIPQNLIPVLARHYGVSAERLMGWDLKEAV